MSRHGASGRCLANPAPRRGAAVGVLLATAAVIVYFQVVWTASVEAPFLDDYDAVLGFLTQWLDAESWRVRWRIFFRPHNEHVLGVPHAWVVLLHGLTGRLDIRLLNLVGNGYALLLLGALYAGFRRDAEPIARLAGFAPAVLLVLQPQHWTAFLSPTISLSNLGVVALAAVAFAALERRRRAATALAAGAALAASLSQANGVLVFLVAPAVLLGMGRRREALLWGLAALAVLAAYLVLGQAAPQRADPLAGLTRPLQMLTYALNFLGCASGLSRPGVSTVAGAALLASFAALVWRGLPRCSPALFGLFLFLLGSVAANALVRAHQGAGAPLLQPRYAFYSAVLLAVTWLAWAELLAGRVAARRLQVAGLTAALAFCLASYADARRDVSKLSERLSSGLDRWWSTGDGGLIHPDFRKASFFMLEGIGQGLIRIPPGWLDRYASAPVRREPPPPGAAVSQRLDALHHDEEVLVVSGWAFAGGSAHQQEVEVVLASPDGALFYPALEVMRIDLPQSSKRLAGNLAPSGFRALIPTGDLKAGDYRLGVLVRKGEAEHLAWSRRGVAIAQRER